MEFTLDYANLAKKLEIQELKSQHGRASPQIYGQLLAIYLLFNDLTSAKFLWKRIPPEIKVDNEELSIIWTVGKLMWKRNYAEIYAVVNSCSEWPKHLKNVMNLIIESTRNRSIALINKGYSRIAVVNAARMLGVSREDILKMGAKLDWVPDDQQCYFDIRNTSSPKNQRPVLENGVELLTKLSDYIIFLENSTEKIQKG